MESLKKFFSFLASFFEKRPWNINNFRVDSSNKLWCKKCGKQPIFHQIAHERRGFNDGGPMFVYKKTPFCHKCDKKPNLQGDPIYREQIRL
jgi:hypothetical protein